MIRVLGGNGDKDSLGQDKLHVGDSDVESCM